MVITLGQYRIRIERVPAAATANADAARSEDAPRRVRQAVAEARAEKLLAQQRHAVERWQSIDRVRWF